MNSVFRVIVATTAIGIAALSLTAPAEAGNGSAVGAGLVGFGVGAIVGSALAPQTVYVAPPPPVYYAPPPPVVMFLHRRRYMSGRVRAAAYEKLMEAMKLLASAGLPLLAEEVEELALRSPDHQLT
jgi:hypothetical protein